MLKIVVLTGAGVSAESGIATFRGSDGLWEGHSIQDVASPEGWRRNPSQVLDFYNARLKNVLGAKPNSAHLELARMQDEYDVTVITQNIDHLHEKAGSKKVIHLHGEIAKCCSSRDKSLMYDYPTKGLKIGDLAKDGHQLRPFIVWFGEEVPMMDEAISVVKQADVLLIIGTSMVVYPAAGLRHYVPNHCKVFLIDPTEDHLSSSSLIHIKENATQGIFTFVQMLNRNME